MKNKFKCRVLNFDLSHVRVQLLTLRIALFLSLFTCQKGISQTYCTSGGTVPWEMWISNVRFNSINNTSDKFKTFSTLGYSDYTNLSTTVSRGETYPLSITPGLSWSGNLPNVFCRISIDWNQNKIFERSESVYQNVGVNPVATDFRIPSSALSGTTRMRVSVKWGGFPTECETFDRGEVEDYTIHVAGGDPCNEPDVTPPVINNCPISQSRAILNGECVTLQWSPPVATDNCGTPTLTFRSKSGNTLSSLSSPTQAIFRTCVSDSIFYTATDARGNRSECAFAVELINACQPRFATSRGTTTFNLTTTGSCAPHKWEVLTDYFPCSRPCQFQGWVRASVTPNLTLTRGPNPCAQVAFDSACFPIGRTTVVYSGGNGQMDTVVVNVKQQTTSSADLALSLSSTPSVFRQWTNTNFKITAQNIGNQPFTNVKIEFKFPNKTVTGGSARPSLGTWNEWCAGNIQCFTWTIPNLAANSNATLDIPLFIQDATGNIVATTTLLSSTPTDNNPANNMASVTLTPAAFQPEIMSLSRQKPTQFVPILIPSISPNPSDGHLVLEVESLKGQDVIFEFSNTTGQIVKSEKCHLLKGTNNVQFDVYELPQGLYLLQTDVSKGRNLPTKFLRF